MIADDRTPTLQGAVVRRKHDHPGILKNCACLTSTHIFWRKADSLPVERNIGRNRRLWIVLKLVHRVSAVVRRAFMQFCVSAHQPNTEAEKHGE